AVAANVIDAGAALAIGVFEASSARVELRNALSGGTVQARLALRFGRTRALALRGATHVRRARLSLERRALPCSVAVRADGGHVVVARRCATARRGAGIRTRGAVRPVTNAVADRSVAGARRAPGRRRAAHRLTRPDVSLRIASLTLPGARGVAADR